MKYALVPQGLIDQIETCRLDLHEILKGTQYQYLVVGNVTSNLWRIANRRYAIVETDQYFQNGDGI